MGNVLRVIFGVLLAAAAVKCATESNSPTRQESAAPIKSSTYVPPGPSAADLAIQNRRNKLRGLQPADAQRELAAMLVEVCEGANPHLNYIQPMQTKSGKGVALYCKHDFFTRYTFSAGPFADDVSRFISLWEDELRAARVARVGVWGTGDYASGAWFELK